MPSPCCGRLGSTAISATRCSPACSSGWKPPAPRMSSAWFSSAPAASTRRRCSMPRLARLASPAPRRLTRLLEDRAAVMLGENDFHRLVEYGTRRTGLAAHPDRHLARVNAQELGQALPAAAH